MRQGIVVGLCVLAAASGAPVQSQTSILPDPTRPPASVSAGARTETSSVVEVGRATAVRPVASPGPARPRLTLIRLDTNGEGLALIDGRLLSVGDRAGDAVVASIDAQGVVLRGAKGWQRLPLIVPVALARDEKESQ